MDETQIHSIQNRELAAIEKRDRYGGVEDDVKGKGASLWISTYRIDLIK